jgi:hypothetical protein
MKTLKIFALLWLLLDFGLLQVSAQYPVPPDGTKSVQFRLINVPGVQPVYCDGVLVDMLTGTWSCHAVWHYVDGNWIWGASHVSANYVSDFTGEVFTDLEHDPMYNHNDCLVNYNFNMKGNKGSHYISSITWDLCNDPNMENLIVHKAVCVENGTHKLK